jgi:hypothetical protein
MMPLEDYISQFKPITLEEMDRVRLMNRTDTKYVFHAGLLPGILKQALGNYRMLSIGKTRLFQYNNLYFDTDGLKFYLDHQNGLRPRYKVRFREYVDTNEVFLEVKRKTNTNRTIKSRKKVERIETIISSRNHQYIYKRIPPGIHPLIPSLRSKFKRLTLVGPAGDERITIDTGQFFSYNDQEKILPNLVICEVKRDACAGTSQFMKLLKQHAVYPKNLSKYCLGTILLKENIKSNRFKTYLLKINKLENEYNYYIAAG